MCGRYMTLTIGTAQRNCRREVVCGDAFTILSGDVATIALADGLGHGGAAEEAALVFTRYVDELGRGPLEDVLRGASQVMNRTRGAAAALLRIDPARRVVSFAGIGNIELRSVSAQPIKPVCVPGILGRLLRKVLTFDYELSPGDLFVLFTDGISSRIQLTQFSGLEPQAMAEAILEQHGKLHDDASCVVVRYDSP